MDSKIRERMVGALVLVALIVLVVPALLKGPGTASSPVPTPDTKGVEFPLDDAGVPAEGDSLVPEPEIAQAKPEMPAPVAPKAIDSPRPANSAAAEPESAGVPPAARPAQPAAAQQSAWAVQLGAFSSRSKAEGLVAKLRARGYSAFVLEYRAGGQLLHRVRVGPEQDRARAVEIAARLRNDGFEPVVAPHP